jgi:hypothetical protein
VGKQAAVGVAEWLAITHGSHGIGASCACHRGVDTTPLNSSRHSLDTAEREPAITPAAEVIEPELVADMTVAQFAPTRF